MSRKEQLEQNQQPAEQKELDKQRWSQVPDHLRNLVAGRRAGILIHMQRLTGTDVMSPDARQKTKQRLRKVIRKLQKSLRGVNGPAYDTLHHDIQALINDAHQLLNSNDPPANTSIPTIKAEPTSDDEHQEATIMQPWRTNLTEFIKIYLPLETRIQKATTKLIKIGPRWKGRNKTITKTNELLNTIRCMLRDTKAPLDHVFRQSIANFVNESQQLIDKVNANNSRNVQPSTLGSSDMETVTLEPDIVVSGDSPKSAAEFMVVYNHRRNLIQAMMISLTNSHSYGRQERLEKIFNLDELLDETRKAAATRTDLNDNYKYAIDNFLKRATHFVAAQRAHLDVELKPVTMGLEAGSELEVYFDAVEAMSIDDRSSPDRASTADSSTKPTSMFPLFEKALALEAKCDAELELLRQRATRNVAEETAKMQWVADEGDYSIECLPNWL